MCLLQPLLRLPTEPLLYFPFEQRLFTYLSELKRAVVHFDCDCHPFMQKNSFYGCWHSGLSLTLSQKRPERQNRGCTCMDFHRSTPAAVHGSPLSTALTAPHSRGQTDFTLWCLWVSPPQKHKPAIYYENFSADSEQIPALCKSSHVMQPSQPLLPNLEKQTRGVPRWTEITNIEVTDLEVC